MFNSKCLVLLIFVSWCLFSGCNSQKASKEIDKAFEVLDDEAYKIFSLDAQIEVLDSGFIWTEGPLWLKNSNQLIFNDIPQNKTFSWSEELGTKLYLSPSGHTTDPQSEGEPGANGMLLNSKGELILCQHGDRRVAIMNAPTESPVSDFKTIIGTYNGHQFSSPNDVAISKSGNLYFTDPPYGLSSRDQQETLFNGVYRFSTSGELTLIDSTLTRPNGIAFSPDEKYLYVANSDPVHAIWARYEIDEETGLVSKKEVFYNATESAKNEKGLPDGLKVNDTGYIFATGPGGVWVFNPDGKVIAKIRTGQATSNCAFGSNQNILYITADDYLMRAIFI
jgi:gluconolactonase